MFSFQGRSTRTQFSEIVAADIVFVAVVVGAYWWVLTKMGGLGSIPMEVMAVVLFVLCALVVPLFVATVATAVRRFHDRGKSGWWALSLLVVYGFFEGMFAKGMEGKNEYGDETTPISPALQRAMPKTPVTSSHPEVKTVPTPSVQATPVVTPVAVVPPVAQKASPIPAAQPVAPSPVQQTPPVVPPAPKPPVSPTPAPSAPVAPKVTPPTGQVPSSTPPQTASAPQAQVPPARSMSEMLAELQKLSAQESSMAQKPMPKPPVAPVVPASTPIQPPTQTPKISPQPTQATIASPQTNSSQPNTKTL